MYLVNNFVFLLLLTSSSCGHLGGDHICQRLENTIKIVPITYLETKTKVVTNWCTSFKQRFRCEKTVIETNVQTKLERIYKKILVEDCCDGYMKIADICIPFCIPSCLHGYCISPGLCECDSGYKGQFCTEECEPGFWGRNCVNKCNCTNKNRCDISNGSCKTSKIINICGRHGKYDASKSVCVCDPGWNGIRCDGCIKGLWGPDCNKTCNCTHECSEVTGECRCKPGFYGPKCSCHNEWCLNGGSCNSLTGDCVCVDGWSGINCTTPTGIKKHSHIQILGNETITSEVKNETETLEDNSQNRFVETVKESDSENPVVETVQESDSKNPVVETVQESDSQNQKNVSNHQLIVPITSKVSEDTHQNKSLVILFFLSISLLVIIAAVVVSILLVYKRSKKRSNINENKGTKKENIPLRPTSNNLNAGNYVFLNGNWYVPILHDQSITPENAPHIYEEID